MSAESDDELREILAQEHEKWGNTGTAKSLREGLLFAPVELAAMRRVSRAPQPDTVTDKLRNLLEWADEYCRTGKCPTYDAVEPARAALTAALNAKGK